MSAEEEKEATATATTTKSGSDGATSASSLTLGDPEVPRKMEVASEPLKIVDPPLSQGGPDAAPNSKNVPKPISSNPIVITRDSFSPPSNSSGGNNNSSGPASASDNSPPSAIIENAMGRNRQPMPLAKVVGIAGGILLVLILLTLLLFR